MELSINSNKQFRRVPYAVLDLAISEGWVKQLCYFLHITSIYENSVVYRYSSRSLSDKMGASKSAINKNVNFLINKGLLKIDSAGNLVGLSIKSLREWFMEYSGTSTGKGLVTVKLHRYIKHTEYNLFARVALNNMNKQKFSSRKRAEVNAVRAMIEKGSFISRKTYDLYKSSVRFIEKQNTENAKPSSNENFFLSDAFLCKATGKSVGTVRSMVSFWESEGLLQFTLVKGRTVGTCSKKDFIIMSEVGHSGVSETYFYKGKIVEFNKRRVDYGSNIKEGNPNSILQLKGQ